MTSDNLLKFLGNREYLHQVSYQELKSMVVQYPYSLSLRYLLAMKSHQEDNTDLDRNIEMLATYGIDRTHLHKIFSADPIVLEDLEEAIVMGEDYLELKELSALEREMEMDGNLLENGASNISFLAEELPSSSAESNILTNTEIEDLPTPPSVIDSEIAVEETAPDSDSLMEEAIAASTIIGGVSLIKNDQSADEPLESVPSLETPLEEVSSLIETPAESEVEDEKEDFIIMDFEEHTLEEVGIAVSSDDLAPSESFSIQEVEIDENGLPADAIEINDSYGDYKKEKEGQINDLFEEAEAEVLAEEAVSDSKNYMDNPEELLLEESEKVLKTSDNAASPSIESETDGLIAEAPEKLERLDKPRPQIPFEISYAKMDPVLTATAVNEVISPTETTIEEEISEEIPEITEPTIEEKVATVLPETKVSPKPAEAFKFDSLDQFEAVLNQDKLGGFTTPVPKTGFSSWQEQYSGVGALSGINLVPLDKSTGKIIRKKKKVVRKEFEKTVAFAEESLTMTEGIASETLAQLLVKQGQYSQARAMYAKLRLIMPEKSSFFAGEIEKIQNLPDEPS